ncbi:MAG: YARHG domain-containing protein [Firmicutes bacterium]|nr:YARHG domain-containing protein [Bacillota bacterium]
MLCKVCGAQIPDDAAECEFCGAKITDENNDFSDDVNGETKVIDSAEIESRLENEEPEITDEIFDNNERRRRKQMQKMMEDKKQQLSEIEKRRNEKRQKQKRNRIMLIAAICALAVAAAGVGVYYIMQNVNPKGLVDETPAPGMVTEAPAESTEEPTEAPSDELSMTTETADDESASSNTSETSTKSWTSTGNTGSGSSSSSGSGSSSSSGSSKTSSSSGSSSGSSSASSGSSSSSSQSASSASSVNVPAAQAADSGKTTDMITSELATGSEVITNPDTGKLLMTFIIGGTRYYANVSEGSTTDQVQNKYYTITAEPTDETYNGNTIYEITTFTNYDGGDYVLPESGIRLLTDSDISGMSKYDLALARNEIYARHGRKFQTAEYSEYFSSKSWYSLNPNYNYSDDDSNLNDIEIKNVQFLLKAERK